MQTQDIENVVQFSLELEKLKSVMRRTKPIGQDRYENSAEHSWQIALTAIGLIPFAQESVDPLKVLTMLLIHDVVEIDTGDKFAYCESHDDYDNELAAARRIFGLLPAETGDELLALWQEFELKLSAEGRFAKAIDRLLPVLQNVNNDCQSWLAHGVTVEQVLSKNAEVANAHPNLWQYVKGKVIEAAEKAGVPRH